jgi:hypothetical protein
MGIGPRRAPAGKRAPAIEMLECRAVPTLIGDALFPADNPWNQPITDAPVAPNSQAVLDHLTGLYGDGRLHPDFGQDYHTHSDLYGIPYNVVYGDATLAVHVVIDAYRGESDVQDAPIPGDAVLEGDYQDGPKVGVNARGDSHLLVYDVDHNVAYEFYRASRPTENADGRWHADQETVWDMNTDQFRTLGWTSADAAGLALLPGLVRPDEALPVSQGGQGAINHAIRFTLQNRIVLNQFLYPASHTANPGNNDPTVQPPMGARFRLKASVDISRLNPQSRVIAQAMKDYGLILADNGSNFFFSGASYSVDDTNHFALTFNDNDIQDTVHGLKSLHFSDFEVVDLTPVVTGLSASVGSAGTTITVTGRNFAGGAGQVQVLFGGTPAGNVTVLGDGALTAVVPPGRGTVDVRVQSGVYAPGHSNNFRNPIFGYGVSAVTAADQFNYGVPQPDDPGFERPPVGTGSGAYQYNPRDSPWAFDGSAGVAGNGSEFTDGNPDAPEGTQVAFLQGYGAVSQAVPFAAGTYRLSVSAAQRGIGTLSTGNASSQSLQVLVDGAAVGDPMTPAGTDFASYGVIFTVTAEGPHTLTLAGTDLDGQDNTALLDQVAVSPADSPAPRGGGGPPRGASALTATLAEISRSLIGDPRKAVAADAGPAAGNGSLLPARREPTAFGWQDAPGQAGVWLPSTAEEPAWPWDELLLGGMPADRQQASGGVLLSLRAGVDTPCCSNGSCRRHA